VGRPQVFGAELVDFMRRVYFWALSFLIVYFAIEIISLFALLYLERFKNISFQPLPFSLSTTHREILTEALRNKSEYALYSPLLGWTIKPNGSDGLARANSQGIRGDNDYSMVPPDRAIRISAFGDSFTHSNDVNNENTWTAKLNRTDSRVEVLNFGVGAYGLDQAFLRYKQDGVPYHSHIILIGFMSENLVRSVNVFRLFLYPGGHEPFAKPRFLLERNQFTLLQNPMSALNDYEELLNHEQSALSKLGKHDYFFHSRYWRGRFDFLPSVRFFKIAKYESSLRLGSNRLFRLDGSYDPHSEAFSVTTKIFDEFYREALDHESLPIVVLFPTGKDIERYRGNRTSVYAPLIDYFQEKRYRFIDLAGAFDKYGRSEQIDDLIMKPFLHYSPLANEFVAKYILSYLEDNYLTDLFSLRSATVFAKNSNRRNPGQTRN
jgi:hypothetical protein